VKVGPIALSAIAFLSAIPPVRLSAQVIDTILVDNRNVFDHGGDGPAFVARLANALHIKTRASVIRRSLLVRRGDPYDSARVAESERALRALNVFRFVRVDSTRLSPDGRLALRVVTADGWSSKPQANYSTAGGDQTWEIAFVEQNLLGTASELAASYGRTPDRRRFEVLYLNPHFLARRAGLALQYGDFSDGRKGAWQFGVPFYHTAARRALETYGEAAHESVRMFSDGALDSIVQRRALRLGVTGGVAARATSRDYARLWFAAEWRREGFARDTTLPFPRSTFVTGRAGVEFGHVRFRVLERFNSYARREDVDLSQVLRLGAVVESGVGFEAGGQVSTVWRGGFVVLRGAANVLDSTRVRGGLTVVSQNLPRQTVLAHVEGGAVHRPKPGAEFDPWLEQRAPRLFGAHAFTGNRMAWLVFEDRVLVADDLWGLVGVGLAPFVDYGGAWYSPKEAARLGGDAGVSVRLGPTRSVQGDVAEFAVGYRFGVGRGWAIALRRGVMF